MRSSPQCKLAQAWLDTPATQATEAWVAELGVQTRQFLANKVPDLYLQPWQRHVLEQAILVLYQEPEHWGAHLAIRLFRRKLAVEIDQPAWFRIAQAQINQINLSPLQILPKPQDFCVTVLVPTFNRLSTLRRTVASVLAQSYKNWQLIICDDGSTDGTQDYCQALATRDERIVYLRNEENLGHGKTLERLFESAQTELVSGCSDDDWFYPEHLAENIALFKKFPWIAMASGGMHLVTVGRSLFRQYGPYYRRSGLANNQTELQRSALICPVGPGAIHRKSVLREFAPLDRLICRQGEAYAGWDYLLTAKIAGKYEFAYCSQILFSMEVNPQSTYSAKDNSQEMLFLLGEILSDYQSLFGSLTFPRQLTEAYLSYIARTLKHFYPDAKETPDDSVWGPFLAIRETFLSQSSQTVPMKVNLHNPYTYKKQWLWAFEQRLLRWGIRSLPAEPIEIL